MSNRFAVIVLAAGSGTRMRSKTPKVMHELAGLPLLGHALSTATALGAITLFRWCATNES